MAGEVSLDANGFALVNHRSAVRDFFDDEEVRRVYYPEVERVLKQATGAYRVHIFDHTDRRRVDGAQDRSDAPRQPVQRVHIDHTARSGPQRVRDLLPDEADELLKGRVQVINLWRPIKGPLQDSPLAVCDATTIHCRRSGAVRPRLSASRRRDLFGEVQSLRTSGSTCRACSPTRRCC